MIMNLEKIHPCKRQKVANALKFIEEHNTRFIDRLLVFGSAVTESCTDESDIDFCVCSQKSLKDADFFLFLGNMLNATDNACDVVHYHHIGTRLKQIIDDNGVVVYTAESPSLTNPPCQGDCSK